MGSILYQGKAKNVHSTDKPNEYRLVYLDQVTALNGKKKVEMSKKGELNNSISSSIFEELTKKNITHHWLKKISETEQLVKKVSIIPLEVVVRNIAAGSFTKRFNIPQGTVLEQPILEFYYKDDSLDDPFMNDDHIKYLKIATQEEIIWIKEEAMRINNALQAIFEEIDLTLVDFKIEFGKDELGNIILADEVTPDTCRLWDKKTGASLDKDVFRKDTGDLISVYDIIKKRLEEKGRV